MARPKLGDGETVRLQMKMPIEELQVIEAWRYANHIPSNSEAIRQLCRAALSIKSEKKN